MLGNDPPRLGQNLTIKMGFDHSKTTNSELSDTATSTAGLDFDIMYNFSIVGSVGRLININIKANSEEKFATDNLKNFKIEYKESKPELEDEIIQEVIAGYTGFRCLDGGLQLPGESCRTVWNKDKITAWSSEADNDCKP